MSPNSDIPTDAGCTADYGCRPGRLGLLAVSPETAIGGFRSVGTE